MPIPKCTKKCMTKGNAKGKAMQEQGQRLALEKVLGKVRGCCIVWGQLCKSRLTLSKFHLLVQTIAGLCFVTRPFISKF